LKTKVFGKYQFSKIERSNSIFKRSKYHKITL